MPAKPVQIVKPVVVTRINSSGQIVFNRTDGRPPIIATVIIEVQGGTAKERDQIAKALDRVGESTVKAYVELCEKKERDHA